MHAPGRIDLNPESVPVATTRTRLIAPASTSARNVFSFIAGLVEQFRLLGDRDAGVFAMAA